LQALAAMRIRSLSLFALLFTACAADAGGVGSAEAEQNGDATVSFLSGFGLETTGTLRAGRGLVVRYALDRLPQCRGALGGGAPAWNVTGHYAENGGQEKTFEVTDLSADGRDRVSKPARIALSQGGDVALWFTVSNRWGCIEYDSQFGQNFHFSVGGATPDTQASLVFKAGGAVEQEGALQAGGKVRVRYEQDRLPACRRTHMGNPAWGISGYASLNGAPARAFDTGRPIGADREAVDAILDLPQGGELALWFQVASLGGCTEYDSKQGQNYRFRVAP
jgi:hypothetical protein